MPKRPFSLIAAFLGAGMAWLPVAHGAQDASDTNQATLSAFGSEEELQSYLRRLQSTIVERRAKEEAEREAAAAKWRKEHPQKPVKQKKGKKYKGNKSCPAGSSETSVGASPQTGNISGQTDAGATVVFQNSASGFCRAVTADSSGNYRVSSLQPGTYEVSTGGVTKEVTVSIGGSASLSSVTVMGAGYVPLLSPGTATSNDITNVQTKGVDEGGIVKKAGDYLIVLRRGRLFTIRADGKTLKTISTANAYAPNISADDTWYDEMLVSDDTVVVIGYSYERRGTEIGLFDLSKTGRITHRSTYHLFSGDYYSSRNYAGRLVGRELLFYMPVDLVSWDGKKVTFPGVRQWTGNKDAPFQRVASADRIYRSGINPDSEDQTLHAIVRCDISTARMQCRSSSVLGPRGASFYVSNQAVYLWMTDYDDNSEGGVVRLPFDDKPPTALRVLGSPVDQLSFLEQDGYLNVLVGADAKGARMWASNSKSGGLALFRAPLGDFGGADRWSRPEHYRALPSGQSEDGYWYLSNRFVGNWLLYGAAEEGSEAYAVRIDRDVPATRLPFHHVVERIEAMGRDALVVGSAKEDLELSSVALGDKATVGSTFVIPDASQSESRTHGFFYRPTGDRQGLFGLPVIDDDGDTASVEFLRNSQLHLSAVGELAAKDAGTMMKRDDGCVASCIDWYGDARPIFIGNRVYGLLGYELVEGALVNGRIREQRRLNFQPVMPDKLAPAKPPKH